MKYLLGVAFKIQIKPSGKAMQKRIIRQEWKGHGILGEAKLGCKIPEKMKIGGTILKMHARDRGVL
jgi:hypothetical protein